MIKLSSDRSIQEIISYDIYLKILNLIERISVIENLSVKTYDKIDKLSIKIFKLVKKVINDKNGC